MPLLFIPQCLFRFVAGSAFILPCCLPSRSRIRPGWTPASLNSLCSVSDQCSFGRPLGRFPITLGLTCGHCLLFHAESDRAIAGELRAYSHLSGWHRTSAKFLHFGCSLEGWLLPSCAPYSPLLLWVDFLFLHHKPALCGVHCYWPDDSSVDWIQNLLSSYRREYQSPSAIWANLHSFEFTSSTHRHRRYSWYQVFKCRRG